MFQEVVWGFREGRGELSSGLSQRGKHAPVSTILRPVSRHQI